MIELTPEQTSFLLLGALAALFVVLTVVGLFIATVTWKALGYGGRFKSLQLIRKGDELHAGGVIDESKPRPPAPHPIDLPPEAQQPVEPLN